MTELKPNREIRDMLCIMFYQDAMYEHPDWETRFREFFLHPGYTRESKLAYIEFLEDALSPKYSDRDLEDLFDYCDCEIWASRGGHRMFLQMILEELRKQV